MSYSSNTTNNFFNDKRYVCFLLCFSYCPFLRYLQKEVCGILNIEPKLLEGWISNQLRNAHQEYDAKVGLKYLSLGCRRLSLRFSGLYRWKV